jgi:hypothetical protein
MSLSRRNPPCRARPVQPVRIASRGHVTVGADPAFPAPALSAVSHHRYPLSHVAQWRFSHRTGCTAARTQSHPAATAPQPFHVATT